MKLNFAMQFVNEKKKICLVSTFLCHCSRAVRTIKSISKGSLSVKDVFTTPISSFTASACRKQPAYLTPVVRDTLRLHSAFKNGFKCEE